MAGQEIDIKSVFEETTTGQDYFLVMDFAELDNQPAVKHWLEDGYPLIRQTADYALYDLRRPLKGP